MSYDIFIGLWAGLAAGAIHVVTGPDHLAAVLPLAVRRGGVWAGLAWGAGHSGGVLLLGGLALLFENVLDIHGVSDIAERAVGFLLIALGAWSLRRARLLVVHEHEHEHEREAHGHAHVHIGERAVESPEHARTGRHAGHGHSALGFGIVHGIAGSSHLFGVLPAFVLSDGAAPAYFAGFLAGSAAAMGAVAAFAGRLVAQHEGRLRVGLQLSGAFAMLVGCVWIVHTWT